MDFYKIPLILAEQDPTRIRDKAGTRIRDKAGTRAAEHDGCGTRRLGWLGMKRTAFKRDEEGGAQTG